MHMSEIPIRSSHKNSNCYKHVFFSKFGLIKMKVFGTVRIGLVFSMSALCFTDSISLSSYYVRRKNRIYLVYLSQKMTKIGR